jgi:hypothetical protein
MHRGIAIGLAMCVPGGGACFAGDFADIVYTTGYRPGPGQFINEPSPFTGIIFNDQTKGLGAPVGGGTSAPDNAKLVTLGGFGGSVILGFSSTVMDDPRNAYGLDAIVFGNSFVVAAPWTLAWEPGVIEIARDANANGIPDDSWYVIRAPNHSGITSAVPNAQMAVRTWDNDPGTPTLPADPAWYPDAALYPWLVPAGFPSAYQTATFSLIVPAMGSLLVGHADVSPVLILGDTDGDNIVEEPGVSPAEFYTYPDNPWVSGVDAGSGGGDAFDIAWAVDAATGDAAHLDGFDFIRISSGVDVAQGVLGEISTEIGAVSDASAEPLFYDIDGSGDVDAEDLYAWHGAPVDLTGEGGATALDERHLAWCIRADEIADMEATR